MKTNAILLAGGQGHRMGSDLPKQFLPLDKRPIISYSLQSLTSCPLISELVIVVDPDWEALIHDLISKLDIQIPIFFAPPGKQRQDSVINGLNASSDHIEFSAVHDGARPLIQTDSITQVIQAAHEAGAASLGTPASATLKEVNEVLEVTRTLDRSRLYEMQTPQVAKTKDLHKGYLKARSEKLTLTDELSAIEFLNLPSKIVLGSPNNLKITHPVDLKLAKLLLEEEQRVLS